MEICRSEAELREALGDERVAFVPTMGALHDGHLSLVELAKQHADKVVVSIYVNPTQFAPHEDFDSYPRDVDADCAKLKAAGVSAVYLPQTDEIYPDGQDAQRYQTSEFEAAQGLETDFRPHFFGGVASVVSRLFEIVKPSVAVFGEKDYQQLQVIYEMVEHEGLDLEVIGAEIARDEHGLALSSRNAYLSEGELEIARMLNQVMYKVAQDIRDDIDPNTAIHDGKDALLRCGFDQVDYVAYRIEWNRVLVAAWLGKTRLIDNCGI